MKTHTLLALAMFALSALAGCVDADAQRLTQPGTWPGKLQIALTDPDGNGHGLKAIDQVIKVTADDGAVIDAWLVHNRPAEPNAVKSPARGTILVLHGVFYSKTWFLSLSDVLARRGWDVVLVDLRGHGRSGGEYCSWGALEKRDMKRLMDHLLAKKLVSPNLYVFGFSMGASIALQYAAYDTRCQGVVAIAPPTGIEGVARLLMPLASPDHIAQVVKRAGELGHFDPNESSALDAVKHLHCPMLLVHGTMDCVVPYQHSQALIEAATGVKKLITVPLATHISVQSGRDDWLADRVDELISMSPAASQPASCPSSGPAGGKSAQAKTAPNLANGPESK